MGRTHSGAVEKCKEEGETGRNSYGLTATPHSSSSFAAWHGREYRGVGNEGIKLVFVSQYPTIFLLDTKLNYFSLFCP